MMVLPSVLESIRAHGARAYPYEACGFVLGAFDPSGPPLGLKACEARNSREPGKRRRRFSIEPEEFLAAELKAGSEGLDILAIYHSHPDHPALPSANDLEKALPFYRYLIVSVEKGVPGDLTCWLLENDRSKFTAQNITLSE
ncbi:MAG: M67 family metallopeptidase [Deltaproteobacteria bacterium]|jgi:proteasome lid subunit RPN8/RPN11|nr:M67 family metallopeptidase [Deltaproteobacteria bacterium]